MVQFQKLCTFTAATVAGLLLVGADEACSQAGPFSALGGSWSGLGTIKKSNGGSERIPCRSVYVPSGADLSLRLRCASDSYNLDFSVSVAYQGGSISGQWQETTHNIAGGVSGQATGSGSHVQAVAWAPLVTSSITMTTRGNHQSVSIVTPGAEVPEVVVSLEKR